MFIAQVNMTIRTSNVELKLQNKRTTTLTIKETIHYNS